MDFQWELGEKKSGGERRKNLEERAWPQDESWAVRLCPAGSTWRSAQWQPGDNHSKSAKSRQSGVARFCPARFCLPILFAQRSRVSTVISLLHTCALSRAWACWRMWGASVWRLPCQRCRLPVTSSITTSLSVIEPWHAVIITWQWRRGHTLISTPFAVFLFFFYSRQIATLRHSAEMQTSTWTVQMFRYQGRQTSKMPSRRMGFFYFVDGKS